MGRTYLIRTLRRIRNRKPFLSLGTYFLYNISVNLSCMEWRAIPFFIHTAASDTFWEILWHPSSFSTFSYLSLGHIINLKRKPNVIIKNEQGVKRLWNTEYSYEAPGTLLPRKSGSMLRTEPCPEQRNWMPSVLCRCTWKTFWLPRLC